MNRVAIVVLNWNGIDDTIECLDSLVSQSYSHFEIVVIDNGSVDDSKNVLNLYVSSHPDSPISLIFNPENLGFAGGVNTGINWAIEHNFDSVALFNNDAVADRDWLRILVEASAPKEIGISTGLLLHRAGKTIDSSGDWVSVWGLIFPRNRGDDVSKAYESGFVFGASGGATLYKLSMLSSIGLFDEDFFAYYEDADISYRAQLAGWKVVYSKSARAYHKQGASSTKIPGFTIYQTFKNLPLVFFKDTPGKLLLTIGIRFCFSYWLILLNAIYKGNGIPALKGALMSVVLSVKKIPERRHIQKTKTVSARYIKSILWDDLPPEQSGLRKVRRFFTRK